MSDSVVIIVAVIAGICLAVVAGAIWLYRQTFKRW